MEGSDWIAGGIFLSGLLLTYLTARYSRLKKSMAPLADNSLRIHLADDDMEKFKHMFDSLNDAVDRHRRTLEDLSHNIQNLD